MLLETCDVSTKIFSPSSAAAAPRPPPRTKSSVFRGIFPLSRQLAGTLRGEAQVLHRGSPCQCPLCPWHLLGQRKVMLVMTGITTLEEFLASGALPCIFRHLFRKENQDSSVPGCGRSSTQPGCWHPGEAEGLTTRRVSPSTCSTGTSLERVFYSMEKVRGGKGDERKEIYHEL